MDKTDYINTLKTINLRPGKVKIKEKKEEHILMEQENSMQKIHDRIIKWFMENPNPNDEQVHNFAEQLGIDPDKLEGHVYMILSSILSEGKSKDFNGEYDSKELQEGIKVEKEHTTEPLIAEKIAKDHLVELKDYYTRLKKMEEGAGVVHEIFVETNEVENIPAGPTRDMQILRLSIIAEYDATNLYEKFAELVSDENIKKILLDVAKEEKTHIGEFEALLERIDLEHEPQQIEGEDEVKEKTDKTL